MRQQLIKKLKCHTIKTIPDLLWWCKHYDNGEHKIGYNKSGVYIYWGKDPLITLEDVKFVPKKPKGFKSDLDEYVQEMIGGKYFKAIPAMNVCSGHIDYRDDSNEDEYLRGNYYVSQSNPE